MSVAYQLPAPARRGLEALPGPTGPDASLSERARHGDLEAFAELVELHRPLLRRVIGSITQDVHLAADLVQDSILRAARNLSRFDGRRFSAWLLRIGVNLTLSTLRRQALGHRLIEEGAPRGPAAPPVAPKTPVERLMAKEDWGLLQAAMEVLPPRHRKIVEMRYSRGMRCCEIAQALDTTPNTISIILCRARHRLRREVGVSNPSTSS